MIKDIKKDGRKPTQQLQPIDDNQGKASTIGVKHLISPGEDNLVEVSNIPVGATHALTMLQAHEEQMETVFKQIRAMRRWYVARQMRRKYGKDWLEKQKTYEFENNEGETFEISEFEQIVNELEKLDTVDMTHSFIHRFRHAFFQVNRGKEGFLAEKITILADTDLQTRSPELDDMFKSPTYKQ